MTEQETIDSIKKNAELFCLSNFKKYLIYLKIYQPNVSAEEANQQMVCFLSETLANLISTWSAALDTSSSIDKLTNELSYKALLMALDMNNDLK